MSETYLVAAVIGAVDRSDSGWNELGQAARISLDRVQEGIALGVGLDGWLNSFMAKNSQAGLHVWPDEPLLAHFALHSAARIIETGDKDLVAILQSSGRQAAALLLASPVAVGRYNLFPRARMGPKLCLRRGLGGLLVAARAELGDEITAEIAWLAGCREEDAAGVFPAAKRLEAENAVAEAFVLAELVKRLETDRAPAGLLVNAGPYDTGLATVVERI